MRYPQRRFRRDPLLVLLLGLLLSSTSHAHLLRVFAYAEGSTLHGNAYFAGGEPAVNAAILIQAADGRELARFQVDAEGEFRHRLDSLTDLLVIADSGDGHRAEWPISAVELGAPVGTDGPSSSGADNAELSAQEQQLLTLVERAVARQVGPLRRELQASQDRARLGDLLGGIGLIFGLSGVLLWWRARRTVATPRDSQPR